MSQHDASFVAGPLRFESAYRLLKPWRWLFNPMFLGFEHIPGHNRLLFVGNHTLFGLLDAPLLLAELWREQGVWPRPLGDHIHFKIPGWRELIEAFGVVDGTRENCAAVMREGDPMIVFPGGAREVAKRKGEKYKLIWKERTGFVRMAMQHGYTIVPFAAIGAEDAFDLKMDTNDLMNTHIGGFVRALGLREELVWPIATGIGPTPLPRPQRFYFKICPPIETEMFQDDFECKKTRLELRGQVQTSIESAIEELLEIQTNDPQKVRWPHLFGAS